MAKQDRLAKANELIETIAGCGRHFFLGKDRTACLELDRRGRVWFVDDYTKRRIYTHYAGRWRGFSHGGTLKDFIGSLRDYVVKGRQISIFYFVDSQPGLYPHHWGYGKDVSILQNKAIELGIAPEVSND